MQRQDVKLLIAGWGRLQGWAERYARNLGLHDRATFLGQLSWPDLQQRPAEADLFLFASLRDAFGTVNFEALALRSSCRTADDLGENMPLVLFEQAVDHAIEIA